MNSYKSRTLKQDIIILVFFLIICLGSIVLGQFIKANNPIYIALAAPLSGTEAIEGTSVVQGAELAIARINDAGGVNGKKLKLLLFDDRGTPDLAEEVAGEIASQSPAVAVLGHYFSTSSLPAGRIYQKFGIPAIASAATADALTLNNPWYFRVVAPNRIQGAFMAYYINKILERDRIGVVYESQDAYSQSLADAFIEMFEEVGGEVKRVWNIDSRDRESSTRGILNDLQANLDEIDTLYLPVQLIDYLNLTIPLKRQGLDYKIIGSDATTDIFATYERLSQYPEEQKQPGYFLEGVLAPSSLIFDVAGRQAQQFRNDYLKTYNAEPGWAASHVYDAVQILAKAIRESSIQGDRNNLKQERQKLRDTLASFDSPEYSMQGVTGTIYFDKNGDVLEPFAMGRFQQNRLISALIQLQPVTNPVGVIDLERELAEGRILKIGDRYLYKTNIVHTGIDINEIKNIDEKNSSYLVDLFLWFHHLKGIDAANIEFTNYSTGRLDSGESLKLQEPIKFKNSQFGQYSLYRVNADFQKRFAFYHYPFDRQQLMLGFHHKNLTRNQIIYVVDWVGMRDINANDIVENWHKYQIFSSITDWNIKEVNFFQDSMLLASTLGDPLLLGSSLEQEYSRFNAVVAIERDRIVFLVKNLLPLFFFLGLSYLILFLPFKMISVEAVSGILLAVVFFHLSLLDGLPDGIGYVVALDYAFYTIYILIGLQLVLIVLGHQNFIIKNKNSLRRLLLIGKTFYPLSLVVIVVMLIYQYW